MVFVVFAVAAAVVAVDLLEVAEGVFFTFALSEAFVSGFGFCVFIARAGAVAVAVSFATGCDVGLVVEVVVRAEVLVAGFSLDAFAVWTGSVAATGGELPFVIPSAGEGLGSSVDKSVSAGLSPTGSWALMLPVSTGGPVLLVMSGGSRGDSGIGSWTNSLRAAREESSFILMDDLSGNVDVDSASVSLLRRRRDTLDSPLWSLCRPMRPSFSMATKLVRTLESGLGDSDSCEPGAGRLWLEKGGHDGPIGRKAQRKPLANSGLRWTGGAYTPVLLPRSGGLVSPLFSNMARRFLTWLIVAG